MFFCCVWLNEELIYIQIREIPIYYAWSTCVFVHKWESLYLYLLR